MPGDDPLDISLVFERYGLGTRRSGFCATTIFPQWTISQLSAVLSHIHRTGRYSNPCGPKFNQYTGLALGLRAFLYSIVGIGLSVGVPYCFLYGSFLFLRGYGVLKVRELAWKPIVTFWNFASGFDKYIIAPLPLIREAADTGKALCVDKNGNFLLRSDGYTIMSHAWAETCGWSSPSGWGPVELSLRKKGIPYSHFKSFFERCQAEFLWVDLFALPEVFEDLPLSSPEHQEREELRIAVINTLHGVYTRADKTVVLDSLTLQLHSGSLIDVAVALSLGQWVTRMWTYPEVRLSKRTVIQTANGYTDLTDILDQLRMGMHDPMHRYYALYHFLSKLQPSQGAITPIRTIAIGCANRYTEDPRDRIRPAFCLLGLKWEVGWTAEDGMRHLLHSIPPDDAGSLAGCSAPRTIPPPYSWAPRGLNYLTDTPAHGCTITASGKVRGPWEVYMPCVGTTAMPSNKHAAGDVWDLQIALKGVDGGALKAEIYVTQEQWDVWSRTWAVARMLVSQGNASFLLVITQGRSGSTNLGRVWASGIINSMSQKGLGGQVAVWELE